MKFWEDNRNDPLSARNWILSSLCPQVYGLYVVKLAVALVLAGGVQVRLETHISHPTCRIGVWAINHSYRT